MKIRFSTIPQPPKGWNRPKPSWISRFRPSRRHKSPPGCELVYQSTLEAYINWSLLAGGFSLAALPAVAIIRWDDRNDVEYWAGLTFLVSTSAILFHVSLRCPLRMYRSMETGHYVAMLPRLVPLLTRPMHLEPGSVKPPARTDSNVPWKNLEHLHVPTGKKLVLVDSSFALPVYYNRLLGYWIGFHTSTSGLRITSTKQWKNNCWESEYTMMFLDLFERWFAVVPLLSIYIFYEKNPHEVVGSELYGVCVFTHFMLHTFCCRN